MKPNILIPILTFVAGAVLVLVLMSKCSGDKTAELSRSLQLARDSTKKIVDSNSILTKQREEVSFERIWHDSVSGKTIDSLKEVISVVKRRYYTDTSRFKTQVENLQSAFNLRDSAKAQAAIDSLIIEARSANWSATNLFYQYDEKDSLWRLQKDYDDSVYTVLENIDKAKDGRFNALLTINNQMGKDLEAALKEVASAKKRGKFWFAIGAILGAATNFLHK